MAIVLYSSFINTIIILIVINSHIIIKDHDKDDENNAQNKDKKHQKNRVCVNDNS